MRIEERGFRVSGFGFRFEGPGFGVLGSGFRVSGFGFRVEGCGVYVKPGVHWHSSSAVAPTGPELCPGHGTHTCSDG